MQLVLTTELLLEAYKQGLFPMAYSAGSPYIHWVCPELRGQLSIENLHIPRSLRKIVKRQRLNNAPYTITMNQDFESVIRACADPTDERPETWINDVIIEAFMELHHNHHAHSLEVWQEGKLIGGLYGLALGSAFFGESMFSRTSNASKAALVHLTARLWKSGFTMLDTQFTNPHLEQFGIYEIPYKNFKSQLEKSCAHNKALITEQMDESRLIADYLEFQKIRERHL